MQFPPFLQLFCLLPVGRWLNLPWPLPPPPPPSQWPSAGLEMDGEEESWWNKCPAGCVPAERPLSDWVTLADVSPWSATVLAARHDSLGICSTPKWPPLYTLRSFQHKQFHFFSTDKVINIIILFLPEGFRLWQINMHGWRKKTKAASCSIDFFFWLKFNYQRILWQLWKFQSMCRGEMPFTAMRVKRRLIKALAVYCRGKILPLSKSLTVTGAKALAWIR